MHDFCCAHAHSKNTRWSRKQLSSAFLSYHQLLQYAATKVQYISYENAAKLRGPGRRSAQQLYTRYACLCRTLPKSFSPVSGALYSDTTFGAAACGLNSSEVTLSRELATTHSWSNAGLACRSVARSNVFAGLYVRSE